MLEIVVEGHSIDKFLEIRTLPTVQISMGLSVSVDEFYNVRATPRPCHVGFGVCRPGWGEHLAG